MAAGAHPQPSPCSGHPRPSLSWKYKGSQLPSSWGGGGRRLFTRGEQPPPPRTGCTPSGGRLPTYWLMRGFRPQSPACFKVDHTVECALSMTLLQQRLELPDLSCLSSALSFSSWENPKNPWRRNRLSGRAPSEHSPHSSGSWFPGASPWAPSRFPAPPLAAGSLSRAPHGGRPRPGRPRTGSLCCLSFGRPWGTSTVEVTARERMHTPARSKSARERRHYSDNGLERKLEMAEGLQKLGDSATLFEYGVSRRHFVR